MKLLTITTLALTFASNVFALDLKPDYLTCVGQLNGRSIGYEYKLTHYTNKAGDISISDEMNIDNYKLTIDAFRSFQPNFTGSIQFSFAENRENSTSDEICAGDCSPMEAVLSAQSNWEIGKYAHVSGYASPSSGKYLKLNCILFKNDENYKMWKSGYSIQPRNP
ncbi:MAG: hypothetical protein ACOYL6_19370 [Bacteriovoracaceae bacterium]